MKRWLSISLMVTIIVIALLITLFTHKSRIPAPVETEIFSHFTDKKQNISLDYPSDALVIRLKSQDITDKYLFRAASKQVVNNPYLITLRYGDGLRKASQVTHTPTMDLVLRDAYNSFPSIYKDYKKLSERRFDHHGNQVTQIDFTYTGTDGQTARQRFYIFMRDENTVYYLSLQSHEADAAALRVSFDRIAESFALY